MNEIAKIQDVVTNNMYDHRMEIKDVIQHAASVQEIMKSVMKKDVHFGNIPGTDKPTLYKSGAEVLCMSFRISDSYQISDLSENGIIRYRVTCTGRHQISGIELGQGMGEASTGEDKYKWRAAICDEEFEAALSDMKRVKYGKKKGGGFYTQKQIRTESSDLANTVLKMACKRAKMAMTLNITAASDIFSQDLEELTEELREHILEKEIVQQEKNNITYNGLDNLLNKIDACRSVEEVRDVWAKGILDIKPTNDMEAYNKFKQYASEKSRSFR
jgi:hypothetical protein